MLSGHSGHVTAADYSPGGKYLTTIGKEGRAIVWEAATHLPIRSFSVGRGGTARALESGTVVIFQGTSIDTLDLNSETKHLTSAKIDPGFVPLLRSFSPDGNFLVITGPRGEISVVAVSTLRATAIKALGDGVWDLGWAANTLWLRNGDGAVFFDTQSNQVFTVGPPGQTEDCFGMMPVRDTTLAVLWNSTFGVYLYDMGHKIRLTSLPVANVEHAFITSDGKHVAVFGKPRKPTPSNLMAALAAGAANTAPSALFWLDTTTNSVLWSLPAEKYGDDLQSWTLSPSGDELLLAWFGNKLEFVNTRDRSSAVPFLSRSPSIELISETKTGMILVGDSGGRASFWDPDKGSPVSSVASAETRLGLSNNTTAGLFAGPTQIRIFHLDGVESVDNDIVLGNPVEEQWKHEDIPLHKTIYVSAAAVTDDGKHAAWVNQSLSSRSVRLSGLRGELCQSSPRPRLNFSPDGSILAASCQTDGMCLFSATTGKRMRCGGSATTGPFLFLTSGARIITSGDDVVTLRDFPDLAALQSQKIDGPTVSLAITGNEDEIAVATSDRLSLLRVPALSLMDVAHIDRDSASAMGFSHNGLLMTGGQDGLLRFWKTSPIKMLVACYHSSSDDWATFSPGGLIDASGDAVSQVGWRDDATGTFVRGDAVFNNFYFPNLLARTYHDEQLRPVTGWQAAGPLSVPGVQRMIQLGSARIIRDSANGTAVLCLGARPEALRIFRDGILSAWQANDFEFDRNSSSCQYRKNLDLSTQLEVLNAPDAVASSEIPKTPFDGQKWAPGPSNTTHILIIGVGDYDPRTSGFDSIPAAAAGARMIYSELKKVQSSTLGFHLKVWPPLIDKDATKAAIVEHLQEMTTSVRPNDSVVLYISGHGIVPAGQSLFYFIPHDGDGTDLDSFRRTAISSVHLADWLRSLYSRHVAIIIDACQSGGSFDSLARAAEGKFANDSGRSTFPQAGSKTGGMGVFLFAAASPLQSDKMPEKGVSRLAEAFLRQFRASTGQGRSPSIDPFLHELAAEFHNQNALIWNMGENFQLLPP